MSDTRKENFEPVSLPTQQIKLANALDELATKFREQLQRYGSLSMPQTFDKLDEQQARISALDQELQAVTRERDEAQAWSSIYKQANEESMTVLAKVALERDILRSEIAELKKPVDDEDLADLSELLESGIQYDSTHRWEKAFNTFRRLQRERGEARATALEEAAKIAASFGVSISMTARFGPGSLTEIVQRDFEIAQAIYALQHKPEKTIESS